VVDYLIPSYNCNSVGIDHKARTLFCKRIKHNKIKVLTIELFAGIGLFVVCLKCKTCKYLSRLFDTAQVCSYIWVWYQLAHQLISRPFYLLFLSFCGPIVTYCSRHNITICPLKMRKAFPMHLKS